MYKINKRDKGICTTDEVDQTGNKNKVKDYLYPEVNCNTSMIVFCHITAYKKKTGIYNNQKTGHNKQRHYWKDKTDSKKFI